MSHLDLQRSLAVAVVGRAALFLILLTIGLVVTFGTFALFRS
jgi:hypothetical protein